MSIYIQLIIASLFWGTNVIVMKLLLKDLPFLFLAFLRVFISLICLAVYMKSKDISFQYSYKKKAFIVGILGIYLNFFFTFLGMNEVKGIDNAFMNALAPTMTFLFSVLLLKKKGNVKEYFALMISIFAFLLSIHFQLFSIRLGFYYLLFGMILYMLSNVLIQKWKLKNSLNLSFYELVYGFAFLSIHCFIQKQFDFHALSSISLGKWILFLIVSGVGFAFIQVTYMKSIEVIGAFQTSFFLSLNPMITYVESLFFLNEEFDILHFLAFILLGISIFLMKKKSEKDLKM